MTTSRTEFLAAWSRFSGDAIVLVLFLQMPIGCLFKLPSWQLLMSPFDIVKETALIVVLYGAAAVLLGFLVAVPVVLLKPLSRRLSDLWQALCITLMTAVVLFTLVPVGMAWWKSLGSQLQPVLGHAIRPRSFGLVLLVLIVAALVIFVRRGWVATMEGFSSRLSAARRPTQVVVALCLALVLVTGHARWQPFGWHRQDKAATAPAKAPNVILISIDTLAAKDMSLYGYRLPTTPNIDAFARSAYVFDNFYANSNYTVPTITTMQTGRYPTSHHVTQLRARLARGDGERTLPRVMQQNGYVTAGIVANDAAHPMYLRFSEAFDFQAAPAGEAPGHQAEIALTLIESQAYHWLWDWWCNPYNHVLYPLMDFGSLQARNWFPAERVIDQAADVAREAGKPLFLWTHFMSPHEPYLPPAPFLGRFLPPGELDEYNEQVDSARGAVGRYAAGDQPVIDRLRLRYDEYIAYTDDAVQRLLDRLRGTGVLDNAVIIITADHGQSFEKGWHGHRGPELYDALIHIPLLVQVPGQTAGARISSNAEQVDLLPTVLDLAGLQTPPWAEGETLRGAFEGGQISGKPKFSFDLERESRFRPPSRGNYAVIQGREKFIHHQLSGCEELYDLAADPSEDHNLVAAAAPEKLATLRQLIEAKVGVALKPAAIGDGPAPPCSPTAWKVAG